MGIAAMQSRRSILCVEETVNIKDSLPALGTPAEFVMLNVDGQRKLGYLHSEPC
jgi:hypothetical protein